MNKNKQGKIKKIPKNKKYKNKIQKCKQRKIKQQKNKQLNIVISITKYYNN